eukprot:TRINITY_DN103_c3_g1_i1.p1 TRINITY_DN103_c3_g1~~TRINITY_DN103_c3_g1_i1.p1  ORF type:complete len:2243 (+),score=448.40 TRINITY_DN103_c3_g1_i1:117-6845(+)
MKWKMLQQTRCLWKLHQPSRAVALGYELIEWCFVALVFVYALAMMDKERTNLRNSPEELPFYSKWPQYDDAEGYGAPVHNFTLDDMDGKEIWFASGSDLPEKSIDTFIDDFRTLTGIPENLTRLWNNTDDMLDYLNNPKDLTSFSSWRRWYNVVGQGMAAIIVNNTDYTLYIANYPRQDKIISVQGWEQSPSVGNMRSSRLANIQIALETTFSRTFYSITTDLRFNYTRYDTANPPNIEDIVNSNVLMTSTASSIGLYALALYLVPFLRMVTSLARSRQMGIKSFLEVNGVSLGAYYLSFTLISVVPRLIMILAVSAVMSTMLLPDISMLGFASFLTMALIALVPFALFLSIFCRSIINTWRFAVLVYLATGGVGALNASCSKSSLVDGGCFHNWGISAIFTPATFVSGVTIFTHKQVEHWNHGVSITHHPSLGTMYAMLLVNTVVYSLLAFWASGVFLEKRPVFFPFSRSFWTSVKHIFTESTSSGITAQNVSVVIGQKVILRDINLSTPQGSTLALLGHNGAGKTTFLKVITNMLNYKGEVRLCGLPIEEACRRGFVGYCPQEIVRTDATVLDLLELVACIKGVPFRETRAHAERAAANVGLYDHLHRAPTSLALGNKRKLGVALAFLGNPRIVILDEPTAGLDSRSRRQVWDLIRRHKNATCVFTTHLLDEACLGDTIAIMHEGRLPDDFIGSMTDLKKKFNCGQSLDIVKTGVNVCDDKIMNAVRPYIPETYDGCVKRSGRGLTIPLPDEGGMRRYVGLLKTLQDNEKCKAMGVESFSLRMTGLEDVLVKLCDPLSETVEVDDVGSDFVNITKIASFSHTISTPLLAQYGQLPSLLSSPAESVNIPMQMWIILYHMKARATFRSLRFYSIQLIFPVAFIILSILYTSYVRSTQKNEAESVELSAARLSDEATSQIFVRGPGAEAMMNFTTQHPLEWGVQMAFYNNPLSDLYMNSSSVTLDAVGEVQKDIVEVRTWFNESVSTSIPVVINYFMNAMRIEQGAPSVVGTLKSFPVYTFAKKTYVHLFGACLSVCFAIITAVFAGRLVQERNSGARNLTQLCGVHDTTFYVAYGLGDCVTALLAQLIIVAVFGIWLSSYGSELFGLITTLLLLYTPAILAMNYTLSYVFSKGLNATVFCTIYHIAISSMLLISPHTGFSSRNIFRILSPLAAMLEGILYFLNLGGHASHDALVSPTASKESLISDTYFTILYQLISWSVLLTLAESGYKIKNLIKKMFPRPTGYYENEAALAGVTQSKNVRDEMNEVVNSWGADDETLYVKQLRKVYKNRIAVSGMYLKLTPGTCFGLLSPSGAGKTTAVTMMAGLMAPSQGEVTVRGLSNLYPLQLKKLQKLVGYLPQTDPLPPGLTVFEVVDFYARLKGVPGTSKQSICNLLKTVGLEEYIDRTCGALSGGNKRLVALLLALLGSPPILLLDEPTAAMDPATRQKAWWLINTRTNQQHERPIVVLTTNSLKEADTVCNKVGVMIQGHLSELGNPKELKEQHSSGYFLPVLMTNDKSSKALTEALTAKIPGTKTLEAHGRKLEFQFPSDVCLPDVIDVLENEDHVSEYSISKMMFEQTYLHAVEQQRAAKLRGGLADELVPPLRVCILIVGSRGDVQPFLAFSERLQAAGHVVRIATHECFRSFVTSHGVDFSPIGGDPEKLMQFMVEHPSMITTNLEEIRAKRSMMSEIFSGCWNAASTWKPDVLIANPPTQVHVHIAEALHIPLQIHFTMPWSPTKAYLHPLAVVSALGNEQSYGIVEDLMWLGMSDIINNFRASIGLRKIKHGSGLANSLKVPHIYCVSESLVPKPTDWAGHISVSGFWFLDSLAQDYDPPQDLAAFLAAGPPPIYIGFGSIVVPSINALEKAVFGALRRANDESIVPVRAIVSPGWAKLGMNLPLPEYVFLLDKCPHDWLFPRCAAVVHHGGAGTTAAGLRAGKPTVVIPFFGDQPFWGKCCERQNVGPTPIPYKQLTAKSLARALMEALQPRMVQAAKELSVMINSEAGVETGLRAFYNYLPLEPSGSWRVECVENQRWFPVIGWSATLAVGDPSPYSDETGSMSCDRMEYPCPEGWQWEDEWRVSKVNGSDPDGFRYATSFKGPWRQVPSSTDVVRRRLWFRRRTRTGVKENVGDEVERLRKENKDLQTRLDAQAHYIQRLISGMGLEAPPKEASLTASSTPEDPDNTLSTAVHKGCTDVAQLLLEYRDYSDPFSTRDSEILAVSSAGRISEMDMEDVSIEFAD